MTAANRSENVLPNSPPMAAGGMASPPVDPPPASSASTPLQGQDETNRPQATGRTALTDELTRAAFEFGWQSRLQHERTAASPAVTFESVEAELAHRWRAANSERFPWEAARAIAQDAWNQVHDAVAAGTEPKR